MDKPQSPMHAPVLSNLKVGQKDVFGATIFKNQNVFNANYIGTWSMLLCRENPGFHCYIGILNELTGNCISYASFGKGPSNNYIRKFSRFLDPPTPPVAHSMHLNDPPPLLRTSSQESETPPPPPFFNCLLLRTDSSRWGPFLFFLITS